MYTFDYIRAYGSLIGASQKTIQRMVERADAAEVDLALEPVWFVEGDGWKTTSDIHPSIRDQVRAWVVERGGRSDEFIFARDLYGAVEVEQETVLDSRGKSWQDRLCQYEGWSDPSNIVWAARAYITNHLHERRIVVLQTVDSGVQVYVSCNDGTGWTVGVPNLIASY